MDFLEKILIAVVFVIIWIAGLFLREWIYKNKGK